MASVSFFLRGKLANKESTIYLRFRDKSLDITLPVNFLSVKPSEWKDGKCKSPSKRMKPNDIETINVKLGLLEDKVLEQYKIDEPDIDVKEWLKNVIDPNAQKKDNSIPDEVLLFFDYYILIRSQELTVGTIRDIKKKKNNLSKYVDSRNKSNKTFKALKFKHLDNNFRIDFENYFKSQSLKSSYFLNTLKTLKTICRFADSLGVEVHRHAISWRLDFEKARRNTPQSIYLTLEELNAIEKKKMPHEYLENAKDWLLVACFTGQRASDYLRFSANMITTDSEGQKYLEFIQKKTGTKMKIPLLKKVEEILNKRGGEFPRKISDVKLNLYIKEVCKIAKINDLVFNEKTLIIEEDGKKKTKRNVAGNYPKHELVTSHIGRKSLASNFYGKVPTSILKYMTGHTTEKELLTYIHKTDNEKAKLTSEVFKNLGF